MNRSKLSIEVDVEAAASGTSAEGFTKPGCCLEDETQSGARLGTCRMCGGRMQDNVYWGDVGYRLNLATNLKSMIVVGTATPPTHRAHAFACLLVVVESQNYVMHDWTAKNSTSSCISVSRLDAVKNAMPMKVCTASTLITHTFNNLITNKIPTNKSSKPSKPSSHPTQPSQKPRGRKLA